MSHSAFMFSMHVHFVQSSDESEIKVFRDPFNARNWENVREKEWILFENGFERINEMKYDEDTAHKNPEMNEPTKKKSRNITCTRARHTHTQTPQRNRKRRRRANTEQSEAKQQQQQQLISNQHANSHRKPIIQLVDKRISSNIININYHLFRQTQAQQNAVNARCSVHFLQVSFSFSLPALLPFYRHHHSHRRRHHLLLHFYVSVHSMCIECLFKQSKLPTKYETSWVHRCTDTYLLVVSITTTLHLCHSLHQESQTKILRIFIQFSCTTFPFPFHSVLLSFSISLHIIMNRT